MMKRHRLILALAALLALALPAHAWHCRAIVVVPGAASYATATLAAPVASATYHATYTVAPAATYAVAPAATYAVAPAATYAVASPAYAVVAAPVATWASGAAYAVAAPVAAPAAAPAAAYASAAPCSGSVTDREIEARLSRVGATLGAGTRLAAVQPMTNAQLTERLAQLAATVEALAQVVENHGKRLGGK